VKYLNRAWNFLACKIGKPNCHREWRKGIDYAICNWCNRQSEVHSFGGPQNWAKESEQ
jgi:hypothetical protein